MRHITRKRLLSFFLAMALILTFSPISAAATYTPEEHEVDEDTTISAITPFTGIESKSGTHVPYMELQLLFTTIYPHIRTTQ